MQIANLYCTYKSYIYADKLAQSHIMTNIKELVSLRFLKLNLEYQNREERHTNKDREKNREYI